MLPGVAHTRRAGFLRRHARALDAPVPAARRVEVLVASVSEAVVDEHLKAVARHGAAGVRVVETSFAAARPTRDREVACHVDLLRDERSLVAGQSPPTDGVVAMEKARRQRRRAARNLGSYVNGAMRIVFMGGLVGMSGPPPPEQGSANEAQNH